MPRTRFEESTVETTEVARQSETAALVGNFTLPPYNLITVVTPFPTTQPQAEQHIAQEPFFPNALAIACSDFDNIHQGRNVTKFGVSLDNGLTWTEQYYPVNAQGLLETSDGLKWEANSDPVLAFADHGDPRGFMVNLFLNGVSNPNDFSNGIYVSVADKTNGFQISAANTYPVQVWSDPATPFFGDKEWIAVDNSPNATRGNLYVAWTRFFNSDNAVRISKSTDHAKTWSLPVRLNPDSQIGHVQGVQVQVGPLGEVYVLWELTQFDNTRQIWFIRSLDGGNTWRAPHQITKTYSTLNFGPSYRTNSFAKMRINPINGDVHILFVDQPSFTVGPSVNHTKSVDGGVSFSPRVRVNDVTGFAAFMPSIAIDTQGRVHTTWYDTRNSGSVPGNPRFYDVYAAYSSAPGVWSTNKRVTAATIDAGVGDHFIGDYSGIRADAGFAHPIWTSGGFNGGRVQVATLQVP